MEKETLLTAVTAAEQLGISPHTVWKAVRLGEIETLDIPGPQVVFTESALKAWVAQRLEAGNRIDNPDSDLVAGAEIAEIAGVTDAAVRNWIRRGQAEGVKVRGQWCMRWDEARRIAREKGFLTQLEQLERSKKSAA
ncbi:MAG: helix-turn-helix domain-containing protein [Deltaproteobacteria bacterium]|nr:helix-turn-helix domain-containing protein [Deltaproteobacteria bacterium]